MLWHLGAAPSAAAAAPAAAPIAAAGTDVIFVYDPEPNGEIPGYRTFNSVRGRKKSGCTWHEGMMSEGAQVPDVSMLQDLSGRGGGAWHLTGDTRGQSSSEVLMIQPDMSANDPGLSKLL